MPPTALTVQEIKSPFAAIAADGADFTVAAMDAVNGNSFVCTGREIIVIRNSSGSSARTVTITSVADQHGRSGDITAYSIGIGEYATFGVGLTNSKGWKQTSGQILLTGSHAELLIAILRLPQTI